MDELKCHIAQILPNVTEETLEELLQMLEKLQIKRPEDLANVTKFQLESILSKEEIQTLLPTDQKRLQRRNTRTKEERWQRSSIDNPIVCSGKADEGNISSTTKEKEFNILLIGQTGAGKTTWINAFINYGLYESFQEAKENKFINLTTMKFDILDKSRKKTLIKIERPGDFIEDIEEAGESVTQQPYAYTFYKGKTTIRLIDTPGVGDTRDKDDDHTHDKHNLDNILYYLTGFTELHCICLFFKCTENRSTSYFEYCLNELLRQLHFSAAANIVFCFTHTRHSYYTPGSTDGIIEKHLEHVRRTNSNVQIQLNDETMYCFENEPLNCLVACTRGIEPLMDLEESCSKSWKKSSDETKRLLDYITLIKPHGLSDTKSLLVAKETIRTLVPAMVDINFQITENRHTAVEKSNDLDKLKKSMLSSQKKRAKLVLARKELQAAIEQQNKLTSQLLSADSEAVKKASNEVEAAQEKLSKLLAEKTDSERYDIICAIDSFDKHEIEYVKKPRLHPCTICTSAACSKLKTAPRDCLFELYNGQFRYICHDVCKAAASSPEIIPNIHLKFCSVMFGSKILRLKRKFGLRTDSSSTGPECKQCGCSWKMHRNMKDDYIFGIEGDEHPELRSLLEQRATLLKNVEELEKDLSLCQKSISEKEDMQESERKQQNAKIAILEESLISLENEKENTKKLRATLTEEIKSNNMRIQSYTLLQAELTEYSAKFTYFVKSNALFSDFDLFKDYVKHHFGSLLDIDPRRSSLQKVLDQYLEKLHEINITSSVIGPMPIEDFFSLKAKLFLMGNVGNVLECKVKRAEEDHLKLVEDNEYFFNLNEDHAWKPWFDSESSHVKMPRGFLKNYCTKEGFI